MDIMKLIDEYAIYRSVRKDINNKLCRDKIQSHISAMQEVVGKAKSAIDPKMIKIHGGNCICSHCELIRAIDKLEAF